MRKLPKDVLQENKEGKQKREGNEIQTTSNPGEEKNSNHRKEVDGESWPTVLDSSSSRKERKLGWFTRDPDGKGGLYSMSSIGKARLEIW